MKVEKRAVFSGANTIPTIFTDLATCLYYIYTDFAISGKKCVLPLLCTS